MNLAVLGAQWGDEGKGKIVDLLTPNLRSSRGIEAATTPVTPSSPTARSSCCGSFRAASCSPASPASSATASCSIRQSLFAEIDELTRGRHRRQGPVVRQRQGASHPSVPPRARPAQRGAARRAQDRHDEARHRSGVRGQDRARGVRVGDLANPRRPLGERRPATMSPRATGLWRNATWTGSDVLDDLRALVAAHGAVRRPTSRCSCAGARSRQARSCSKARRARFSTSITARIRS